MNKILSTDFRYDINALRGIAIIGVVAFHYELLGISGGFAGVDIFFVISGYLITSKILKDLQEEKFSYFYFYISRVRRIFPALVILCLVCSIWGWIYQLPRDFLSNARHELYALLFVSNYAFTNERGYFDIASSSKPFLHTWSLSVEGQFYVFLPVLLVSVYRFGQKKLLPVFIALFVISLGWCLLYSQINAADNFYQLPSRAWEFLAGSILSLLSSKKRSIFFSNLISWIGLSILAVSLIGLNSALLWPSDFTLLPILGSVFLIAAGDSTTTRWLFRFPILQKLGDISYSFYLWHWPVLVFGRQYVTVRLDRELSQYDLLALIFLSLGLAILSYRFVEKPIRSISGWWTSKRLWQVALLVLVGYISFTISVAVTKGFPNRLPDYVKRGFAAVVLSTPRRECFRDDKSEKAAKDEFCQFGAQVVGQPVQPSFILWGDSHANMYLSTLTDVATLTGQVGLIATQTGCRSTLPNQPNDLNGSKGVWCAKFSNEVNDFIERTPTIKTVIIGRLWSDGESFNRTIALIKHLVSHERNVIVIGPVPYLDFNVPETWLYQQIREQKAIDSMTANISGQQRLFEIQAEAKSQLSEQIKSGRVIFVEPFKRICGQLECVLVRDGVSYFRDVTHLSEAGALLLREDFLEAFQLLTLKN